MQGVYILSIDAKDLYLSNNYINPSVGGYNIRKPSGDISTKKFINTFDYSLDLIKLREVYERVYRRHDFGFMVKDKEYTQRVINVTFKYSVKEYNAVRKNIYIKNGYSLSDINLVDNVDVRDGELIAIQTDEPVQKAVDNETLGKYFYLEGGQYKAKTNIKNVLSVAQLRDYIYENGFNCDGIHYIRFKRSSGSSRRGKCLFIDEKLYSRMHKWELCGLKVKEGQVIDLAALEAYISLTTSSIIGTLEINPENILVIDDYTSSFCEDVIAVRIGEDKYLNAAPEEVEIQNSIWDGQSLMDKSLFGEWQSKGMLLLRNRFFKSCCFNVNIQEFFADNGITDISQLNGFTIADDISQIKLITTPSSIKYLKFGSLQDWLSTLDPLFGVVKYEKKTHFLDGRLVQTHYQLINTLQLSYDEVKQLLEPSLEYVRLLKEKPEVLRNHIKYPITDEWEMGTLPLNSKNDIVYKLLGMNNEFTKTKLYTDFRNDLIKSQKKNIKSGHVLVNGNYSTLLGNPIEMLMAAIGKFDGKSVLGVGNICSTRFEADKLLLGSRSPHVTIGNILLARNKPIELIGKYINLTDEIVCINSIGENILQRLSGCDFDSDTMLLTDNDILIKAAMRNYDNFLVPTSLVEAKKTKRMYTNLQKSDLDIKTSVNKIGDIINLAQELNTLLWDMCNTGSTLEEIMPLYCEVAKLDVLSGIEIDRAKKEFVINSAKEIDRIKEKYCRRDKKGRLIKPNFFGHISRQKGYYDSQKKCYQTHQTSMDYLQKVMREFKLKYLERDYIPFVDIVNKADFHKTRVNYEQVNRVLDNVRQTRAKIKSIYESDVMSLGEKYSKFLVVRQECIDYIDDIRFGYSTMYWLLKIIESDNCKDIRRDIFHTLFGKPNIEFYKLIDASKGHIPKLEYDINGEYCLYNYHYKLGD